MGCGQAIAQSHAVGPWRVVYQPVRQRISKRFGCTWADSTSSAIESVRQLILTKQGLLDTATEVRYERQTYPASWNASAKAVVLFAGCENPLEVPVRRGAALQFRVTGAKMRFDPKRHCLWLAPSATAVMVWAYQKRKLISKRTYKVVAPPPPKISIYYFDHRDIPCKLSRTPVQLTTIRLRAISNSDFTQILPEDARYRVTCYKVALVRQGKAEASVRVSWRRSDVRELIPLSRPGDLLQINLLVVERQNFVGEVIPVSLRKQFTIPCPWDTTRIRK